MGTLDEVKQHYTDMRTLPDGRLLGVHRLMFHWTVHIDIDEDGYDDRYCFATREMAQEAMNVWDGTGDMINWHKHPATGRRRDNTTGRIWDENDPDPPLTNRPAVG